MPSTRSCILIVPAADQATENQWMANNVDFDGGLNTFASPLTADGSTVSNYWSGGNWYDWQYTKLADHFGSSLYEDITADDLLTKLSLSVFSPSLS